MTGALMHLFTSDLRDTISFSMFPELWESGAGLLSGGVISGALAEVFHWLFGKIGTSVVLIITTLLLLLTAFNRTISGIVDAIRTRERLEYIPEPDPEPEDGEPRLSGQKYTAPPKRKRGIDIPLDHDTPEPMKNPLTAKPRESFFKRSPSVMTPDQLIAEYTPDVKEPDVKETATEEAAADEQGEIEDMPLDIPFMESNRRRAADVSFNVKPTKPASANPLKFTAEPPTGSAADTSGAAETTEGKNGKQTEQIEPLKNDPAAVYMFPPVELLSVGAPKSRAGDDEVRINSERLESAFQSFGVNVNISNATRGPAVTRYEAELEAGVKLSKLTSLADDIALSLGTSGVRIAAMPNKISTVGI